MTRSLVRFLGFAILALGPGCAEEPRNTDDDSSSTTSTGGSHTGGAAGSGGTGGEVGPGGGGAGGTGGGGSGGTGGVPDPGCQSPGQQTRKVDLVLAVDNSRSMADKQQVLALTLPEIIASFTNPACVDAQGNPSVAQPANHTLPCPDPNTTREFEPVTDLHVGFVTSSIGAHGADACNAQSPQDDRGHLQDAGGAVPTYQNEKFLAWDPSCALDPDGITDPAVLHDHATQILDAIGQKGCGYESQLESWYRFLADPTPYDTIPVVNGSATPTGIDNVLLQQRKDFLRPDSLLVVVMLSDENDCSIREQGQYFYAAQIMAGNGPFHLPRARQECATNPADPCCMSCGQAAGNCPPDPTCGPPLSALEDSFNLRCFEQKRRFGIDFLYPLDRYVSALTSPTVTDSQSNVVPNPIFSDLDPSDPNSTVRDASLVFLAGIVGVPWQDIAVDPNDLGKGYKTSAELSVAGADGKTGWDWIAGDPSAYVAPADPLMVESIDPRQGTNPATGDALAPPSVPLGNAINGNEYSNPNQNDLQFACIFPLAAPRDCTDPANVMESCDCTDPLNDSPLCEADPQNGNAKTLQVRGKAYPSIRQLEVLKDLGERGVPASICASQISNATAPDYAYRPTVRAIVGAVKAKLQ